MSRRIAAFVGLAIAAFGAAAPVSAQSLETTYVRYDAMGRELASVGEDPDGSGSLGRAAVRNTYDARGNLVAVETGALSSSSNWVSQSDPVLWTGFTIYSRVETDYDGSGRKVEVRSFGSETGGTPTLQGRVNYSYDAFGRPECTAQRMHLAATPPTDACQLGTPGAHGPDRISKNHYDAAGQLTLLQKALETSLQQNYARYSYTPNGKQKTVIDANDNTAQYDYDGVGRLVRWYFPSKTKGSLTASTTDFEEYGYDALGQRTSLRKRDGSTLSYAYDALGRMTKKIVPSRGDLSSDQVRDVYYGYDLQGLELYARFDGHGSSNEGVTSSYDGFGRLTSAALKMDGTTRTLTHQYNRNGARTKVTHPDSRSFDYLLDATDRVDEIKRGAQRLRAFTYNDRGLTASQIGRTTGLRSTFDYDAAGRIDLIDHNLSGSSDDVAYTFAYSPASQTITETRDNDTYAWTGHANDTVAYQVNGLNQYTSADGLTLGYDDNGNLTADGAGMTYLYDVENRLVGVTIVDGNGSSTVALEYDPRGRLYRVTGAGDIGPSDTTFLWDGDELVLEYVGASSTIARRHVHGASVDDPVMTYEGSGITNSAMRQLVADRQGSIIAHADDQGILLETNAYDPYGVPMTSLNGEHVAGRFGYTGQTWIPEIGLWHYKARFYSPTLGRFLQTDPIGYEDQVNLYAYVGNDPINMIDPTGKCSARALTVAGGAVAGDGPLPIGDAIGAGIVVGDCAIKGWRAFKAYRAAKAAEAQVLNTRRNTIRKKLTEAKRGLKTQRQTLAEHRKKLDDYRRNPDAYDNKGTLAKAGNDAALRKRIIDGRIRKVEKEIRGIEANIEKSEDLIKELTDDIAELR